MTKKAIAGKGTEGLVFHTSRWLDVLSDVYGIEPFFLEKGTGSLPLALLKSRIFGNRLVSVPFADYGGVRGEGKDAEWLVKSALDLAGKTDIDFMEIRTPSQEHWKLLEKNGFERRDDYVTFVLDLGKKVDTLFGNLEKRVRNDINKSKKHDITFRDAKGPEDVRTFYGIYLKTMKKIGSPPQSLDFFINLWETFGQEDMSIRLAEYEGKPSAGCLFFLSGKTVNYSYSCSLLEHREMRISDGLLFDSIKSFKEKGFRSFDFGRTRPDSGVYFYKKGWGGKKVTMPYFYKFYKKRIEERQEMTYQRMSDMWRRFMPGFLAKRLGPWVIRQIG